MSLVVDASVAIKWFVEEDLSEEAEAILGYGEPLFAPDLLLAEIGNVLWKKVIRGEVAPDQAHEIAAKIEGGIPVLYSIRLLNARALQIALALGHPVYDCLYIACAEMADGASGSTAKGLMAPSGRCAGSCMGCSRESCC